MYSTIGMGFAATQLSLGDLEPMERWGDRDVEGKPGHMQGFGDRGPVGSFGDQVAAVYGATRNCLLFGCLDLRSMKLYAINPQTLSEGALPKPCILH